MGLISYSIPALEIRRSKKPVALIVSAGYIKPHQIQARGNCFVVNDKKVRGIYDINNKYRYMWGPTPVYWYAVQEANPIDPIEIDRINRFMEANSIVNLKYKDVKHGIRLRQLGVRQGNQGALDQIQDEERKKMKEMDQGLNEGAQKIEETIQGESEKYERVIDVSDNRKSRILLQCLSEQQIIDDTERSILLQKVEKGELNFIGLVDELRESHTVSVIEPLSEQTEKFVSDLSRQRPQAWAGLTQDLRNTRRGLGEMVSRLITPYLSWYASIPASFASGFKKDIEIHNKARIALIIHKKQISQKVIRTNGKYFVVDDPVLGGVYEINESSQYMWNKTPCFLYHLDYQQKDEKLLKHLNKFLNRRSMKEQTKQKRKIIEKPNSIITYLKESGKIDNDTYLKWHAEIQNNQLDVNELVSQLDAMNHVQLIRPLNVDVEGFISTLGAQNAQEWAGFTQDLRNDKKGLADLTQTPVKSFMSAGVILAIGLVVIIAIIVLPGITGGKGGGAAFNPIDFFKPKEAAHFLLPLLKSLNPFRFF